MKRIRIIFILLSFMIPIALLAEGNPQLKVWKKDKTTVLYDLSDEPVTTFENGKLVIKTSSSTVEYSVKDILRYTYEGVRTGIDNITYDNSVLVKEEQDKLSFLNLKTGSEVYLFNANGRLLDVQRSNGTDAVSVSLSSHPQGVYFVKCGNETIKLMKR